MRIPTAHDFRVISARQLVGQKDLRLVDDCANKLQKSYDQIVKEERDHDREEIREKDLEHEKQLLDQKLQAARKQKKLEEKKSVKLPKLSITPFSGTVIGWVRFDNQFSAMVDSQSVPAVTKFSHLKNYWCRKFAKQ